MKPFCCNFPPRRHIKGKLTCKKAKYPELWQFNIADNIHHNDNNTSAIILNIIIIIIVIVIHYL